LDAMIENLPEVTCEGEKKGGNYRFHFSGIPETAVSMDDGFSGMSLTLNKTRTNAIIKNFMARIKQGYIKPSPVKDTYETKAFYDLSFPGYATQYFIFLDADNNIVAYAYGVVADS